MEPHSVLSDMKEILELIIKGSTRQRWGLGRVTLSLPPRLHPPARPAIAQLFPPESPSDVPPSGDVNSYLKLVGHGQVNKPHGAKGTDAERKLTTAPALAVGSSLPAVATWHPDLLLCWPLSQKKPLPGPQETQSPGNPVHPGTGEGRIWQQG